jgi:DNA-binding GntR family transcriptional regulator
MSNSTIIARTAAPLRQQVVRLIREDILNGTLVPGQRLVENGLCEAYGVSRTVIREALRQLESERLITVMPNLGPIVTILTESEIRALYVVRGTLEGLAGELFALNASPQECKGLLHLRARLDKEYRKGDVDSRESIKAEFYQRLLKGTGNQVLTEQLGSIHARIAVFRLRQRGTDRTFDHGTRNHHRRRRAGAEPGSGVGGVRAPHPHCWRTGDSRIREARQGRRRRRIACSPAAAPYGCGHHVRSPA